MILFCMIIDMIETKKNKRDNIYINEELIFYEKIVFITKKNDLIIQ